MKKSTMLSLALTVIVPAGCLDQPTQPEPAAPQFQVSSAATRHIVAFAGKAPAGFNDRVAALGGTIDHSHPAGISVVSGLSADGAAAIGRLAGVTTVLPDVEVTVAPVRRARGSIGAAAGGAEAQSQSNPAGSVLFSWQWHMRVIGAQQAWAAGRLGDPGVTVAILDTGLDYANRDLNGLVDLSRSISYRPEDTDTLWHYFGPSWHPITDLNGHGTNVAAQVSSVAFAFAGVSSRTTLMGVKVLGQNGTGAFSALLLGVLHAADQGADVINLSLGVRGGLSRVAAGSATSLINRVFNYAYQQGALVVVAAGNDGADMDHDGPILRGYCQAPNVVCVSATGPTSAADIFVGPWGNVDALAGYSNFGRSSVSVAAPGGNVAGYVWSFCARHAPWPFGFQQTPKFPCTGGGTLAGMAGTSQAAPHVAGLAALLVAELGKNRPAQIRAALRESADDLGQPGTDPAYGAGRINVARALGLE